MSSGSEFKQKILLLGIFLMSCVDAVFTLMWVHLSVGEEINPILAYCLQGGKIYFVLAKVLLTSLGLFLLHLCRKNVKARRASTALFIFYFALILYHCIGSAIILSGN